MKYRKPAIALAAVPALLFIGLSALPSAQSAPLIAPHLLATGINVDVNLGPPPPPRHEVIVERDRPSKDHVWVPGYWANRHNKHEWVAGHWERPPQGRTVWIEPRWERHDNGYVFVEGRWSESRHEEHEHEHERERDHDEHR